MLGHYIVVAINHVQSTLQMCLSFLPLLSLGKTKADKNIMDHPTLPEGRTKKTAFVLLSHKATNVNDP